MLLCCKTASQDVRRNASTINIRECFAAPGHPASKLPGMLRDLIFSSMQQLNSVNEEGCKADSSTHAFNPIGERLLLSILAASTSLQK